MECKDEVESDGGSFELIDFDDYASDPENLIMNSDVSGNMGQSSDGSLDNLPSVASEKLVIIEGEAVNYTGVSENSLSEEPKSLFPNLQWREGEEGFETEEEQHEGAEEDEEGPPDFEFPFSVESEKRHLKRNLNFDLFDITAPIKLRQDMEIKDLVKDHILRFLPAKSLARSRMVSKDWNQWISSPFLAHLQAEYFRKTSGFFHDNDTSISFISLDQSAYGVPYPSLRFLPQNVSIRSSCNGLLLCQACEGETEYYVCNPANENWVRLPPSSYYHGRNPKIVLAFVPSALNFEPCYQAICPFSLPGLNECPIVYFDIYDSNTQSWRISEMICIDFDESKLNSNGVFVDGVVYWETTGGELLAFDIKNEIYGVQTLPLEGGAVSKVYGELSYVKAHYLNTVKTCVVDVYGGSLMTWKNTICFGIDLDGVEDGGLVECRILANSCDDVLAVTVKELKGPTYLYVYDFGDQKVEKLGGFWSTDTSKLFPYINSLVSVASW